MTTTPHAPGGRADGAPRLRYMPGVDGLRAVAVAAVVVFHLGAAWLPGGYLGVDVFLVISGYLITSLLLAERAATGRIDLVRFWLRRARRLLPAVWLMIAVVLGVMLLLHPDEVGRMRGAVVASLAYVTNWYFVVTDVPYFEQFGRPPVFLHLWSLAVEEQFYLAWPLVLAAGMLIAGRRLVYALAVAGMVASAALAWWMFDPFTATDRLYYGTDTRAVGLLAGVVLAFALPASHASGSRRTAWRWDVAGAAGLVALAAAFVWLDEGRSFLYRGGFAAVGVASAAAIAAAARPGTVASRVFAVRPMVWLGQRSYGVYLWHWPVIHLTRPGEDVPFGGAPLVAAQVTLTLVAATLSYRFVEVPFRRHGVRGVMTALSGPGGTPRLAARRVATAGAGVALVAVIAGVALVPAREAQLAAAVPSPGPASAAAPSARSGPPILFVGDSVMMVAAPELRRTFGRRAVVDAQVGRRFPEGTAIVLGRLRTMPSGTLVVMHLGNNYYVRPEQVDDVVRRVPAGHRVFFTTVRVNLPWQNSVNGILRDAVRRDPALTLIDWHAASGAPGLLLDGAHTTTRGSRLYARVMADAVRPAS